MRDTDGQIRITAEEIGQFHDSGHRYLVLTADGAAVASPDWPTDPTIRLLMERDDAWFEQWDGDWQRACDEQINPIIATYPEFPPPVTPGEADA